MRASVLNRESEDSDNPLAWTSSQLADLCLSLGEKAVHAKTIVRSIHQLGLCDYSEMHKLKLGLRIKLARVSVWSLPTIVEERRSADGTYKWLLRLKDGCLVETVLIPNGQRNTLCLSTQVGCALNCTFCATAQQGFKRNLSSAEIISQLWLANRQLRASTGATISNVVFMGMGEPLLNYDAVMAAASLITDDCAYAIPWRRVTLSTVGYVPGLLRLKAEPNISLTISLHAPTDELRERLIPLNRKYPLAVLMSAVRQLITHRGSADGVTFAYVMLKDINDTAACAMALAQRIKDLSVKVNLIPFNDFAQSPFLCSQPEAISRFHAILREQGIVTTLRRRRGADIAAACGQLAALQKSAAQRTNGCYSAALV